MCKLAHLLYPAGTCYDYDETRPDSQTSISRGGWAGAVIWRAGAVGDAVYMTATVACDWAGAVMQKPLTKC